MPSGIYPHKKESIQERFWSKVNITDLFSCWEWTGYKNIQGYGIIGINGKLIKAHRVAWELIYGPIPENICVLHKCDNPSCVYIGHLFIGTYQDNNADRDRKNRQACTQGELNGQCTLTAKQVLEIRKMYKEGHKCRELSKMFETSKQNIKNIVYRHSWKHI